MLQESATALAELASSVTPDACESLCVKGIVTLSKDRVWAVRVAAAAAVPSVAIGKSLDVTYDSKVCQQDVVEICLHTERLGRLPDIVSPKLSLP